MAIDWTPARLEVDLNYKSKDIVLASEWNNLWKETRLQGNNNTDGIVLLIEIVEGNVTHLTNLDNLFSDLESKVTAHTGNSDIHVTALQKTAWSAKYDKPSGGIPKSDLATAVQSSLEKADTALQQHQDISALTAHVADNNVHVTSDQKNMWSAKYNKPTDGIPKTDLASGVQTSLNKADTALQEHQDISELTTHVSNSNIHVTSDNKNAWNAKYDKPAEGIPKSDLASSVQTSLGKADTALQEHQDISAITNHVANNNIHVPVSGTSDAGKMLTVDNSGNPVWADASASGSGGKSAYTYAVEGGYTLTESDFTTDLGNLHNLPTHISNTNLHIDSAERTAWNAKYDKPSGGIPKTDLASSVQTSLGKAETALQEHQDISGKADKSTTLTCTLTASGWADNVQTVTVPGLITSGYGYIVAPASASYSDYTGAGIYADDVTVANTITFNCSNIPKNNITVNILKVQIGG